MATPRSAKTAPPPRPIAATASHGRAIPAALEPGAILLTSAPARRPLPALRRWMQLLAATLIIAPPSTAAPAASPHFEPAAVTPPEPAREFRGAWVATVKNIDWPSRPGLPVAQQQSELIALLDTAAQAGLNAVLLQVRTACDALYVSSIEPWSEYLTGRMGQAPEPFYDPLAFAVTEAHRRGLELHAWFNPYRARHQSAFSPVARTHISKTRPELVRTYGSQLWLDPGDKEVQDYSLRVVLDVVQRYDIDGVHFDDYFYPYPEKDGRQQPLPFPDWATWTRYRQGGGTLARDDWRRENVNGFLRRVAAAIKQRKPWVKFGISPFGIWRPGNPQSVTGLDAYAVLYADSRRWLTEGICDYLAPQLYWSTDKPGQSFPTLLGWWAGQNARQSHVWPGLAHSNGAAEIASQIRLTRQQLNTDGNLHWSIKSLAQNRNNVTDLLRREVYPAPALSPAYPWLKAPPLARPEFRATPQADNTIRFSWNLPPAAAATAATTAPVSAAPASAWQWVVQRRHNQRWSLDVLSGQHSSFQLTAAQAPDVVAVRALDRFGNLSPVAALQRSVAAPPSPSTSTPGPGAPSRPSSPAPASPAASGPGTASAPARSR